jgi:hypothetical protein
MDAIRRTSTLRRVATTASLAALLLTPAADAAKGKKAQKPKSPVITSVSPMTATVGDTMTIKGKNFRKGKGKNSVGFKRQGYAVVFLRSDVSTERVMTVKLSSKLEKVLFDGQAARFNLRVLAERFGKQYTSSRLSPTIAPREETDPGDGEPTPTPTPGGEPTPTPTPTCAAGTSETTDTDADLLPDGLEQRIGTSGCDPDTDGDGVSDGYEYRSAVDLNDDEYQNPQDSLPYPGTLSLPYPNPLSPKDKPDADEDYDGDGLTLRQEFDLWKFTTPEAQRTLADPVADANGRIAATPLSYSDGLQYSVGRRCVANDASPLCGTGTTHVGRRIPDLPADDPAKPYKPWSDFTKWLNDHHYDTVYLHDRGDWFAHEAGRHPYSILDVNRSGGDPEPSEAFPLDGNDNHWLSDDERDEDADGLTNVSESRVEMRSGYWASCYSDEKPFSIVYGGTNLINPDTDGDGVRDGADDQDFDDVPNMMELSRFRASGYLDTEDFIKDHVSQVGSGAGCVADADLEKSKDDPDTPQDESLQPFPLNHKDVYGQVNPFNPCLPDPTSRSCPRFFEEGEVPAPFDDSPHWWSLQ